MSSPQFWAEVKLRLSSIWLPLISIMLHPRCCSSKVCFSRNAEQLSLRGSETRFCELQMMMTREQYCLQEVMWLLFLFLQRWRRRWFVLQQGKLPRQYLLNYFTDETKKRLKGSIALDECEQVRQYHLTSFDVNFPSNCNVYFDFSK